MPLVGALKKIFLKHFMELQWHSIVLAIAFYILSSWLLLSLSGEKALVSSGDFIYWIMVTASTVGYGDLSPSTIAGKYVVALYVIPLGLSLFGLAIGRLAAYVADQWRKGVQGLKTINVENHILVIGWNTARTVYLVKLLLRELEDQTEDKKVVLCVRTDIENPLPGLIGFVKVSSYNHVEEMARSSIDKASCIIIDSSDDDVTMTTALFCHQYNPKAHTIAYFQEEQLGKLLKSHCPNIECMPSVAVEMMAKSAADPGSSLLHHQLLAVDQGMTQYSMPYSGEKAIPFGQLFVGLKKSYDATLIAISHHGPEAIVLNPSLSETIKPGCTLYYIADDRVHHVDWSEYCV